MRILPMNRKGKLQIPSSKLQRNPKHKIPILKPKSQQEFMVKIRVIKTWGLFMMPRDRPPPHVGGYEGGQPLQKIRRG
jgi:hypothetical protein